MPPVRGKAIPGLCSRRELRSLLPAPPSGQSWATMRLLQSSAQSVEDIIRTMPKRRQIETSGHITAFAEDARRIVLTNRYITDLAPL